MRELGSSNVVPFFGKTIKSKSKTKIFDTHLPPVCCSLSHISLVELALCIVMPPMPIEEGSCFFFLSFVTHKGGCNTRKIK
jgi:hypothetical protein